MKKILIVAVLLLNASMNAGDPMIVAHRGASLDAPENTVPAFKLAWEQGADAIEGDFHLTKDGQIVCIHDEITKRVSSVNRVVRDSTLAELRALDFGSHYRAAFKGTAIPTLEEVLSTIPDRKTLFIEIKCGAEIISPLLEKIEKSGVRKDQIVVICFDEKVLQEFKKKAPQFKVSWLCSFKKDKTGAVTPSLETVLKTLESIQADGLSSNTAISEPFITAVEKHGYQWHVWTVDDLETARRMKASGVTSITTNKPGFIKHNLSEPSPAGGSLKDAPEKRHSPSHTKL